MYAADEMYDDDITSTGTDDGDFIGADMSEYDDAQMSDDEYDDSVDESNYNPYTGCDDYDFGAESDMDFDF